MHDGRAACLVEAVKVGHRGVQRKEGVERQRRRGTSEEKRLFAAQPRPFGVSDRGHGGQAIERSAQDDNQQAGVTAFCAREPWHIGPGEERARSQQELAAARSMSCHGLTSSCVPRRNVELHTAVSSALKLRRHEKKRERLWTAFRAGNRL